MLKVPLIFLRLIRHLYRDRSHSCGQFRYFAGQAMAIEGKSLESSISYQPAGRQMRTWIVREQVGVVAAIVLWNSPLVLTAMKLAPALAAGAVVSARRADRVKRLPSARVRGRRNNVRRRRTLRRGRNLHFANRCRRREA